MTCALHLEDPGSMELIVFAEPASRFGEAGGRPLERDRIPGDRVARLLLDVRERAPSTSAAGFSGDAMDAPTGDSYPALVMQVAASLCEGQSLWCMGEVLRWELEVLRSECPVEIPSVRSGAHLELFSRQLCAKEAVGIREWPSYHQDYGIRVLGGLDPASRLSRELAHLTEAIRKQESNWESAWLNLRRQFLTRESLAEICRQTRLVVMPDGPRLNVCGFHSARYSAAEMFAQVFRIAADFKVPLAVTWDPADSEYLDLL